MDINRKTAYMTLYDIETKKQYSNIALNHHINMYKPDSKGFVRELVYGVLENLMLLDYIIDKLIPKSVKNVKKQDLTILRMGIYQIAKMDSVPDYAAVDECVKLAKKYARGRDKFVNGVLRSYIKGKLNIKLPNPEKDFVKYLSVKYSYEPWIIDLWLETYDEVFVEELLAAGNKTPLLTIRVNGLKVTKPDLTDVLEKEGFEVIERDGRHNSLGVVGPDLLNTDMYKDGLFSIQDESSQMVADVVGARPNEFIIDVCAAPGGKTFAMAEKMLNKGNVLARDVYQNKIKLIEKEAKRLSIVIVESETFDSKRIDEKLIGKADRVLVDAPCSGLGVIRRKPEIKYKKNLIELESLPVKQLQILQAASNYVKDNGVLVYSTCTINPYENERVISDFLRKNSEFYVCDSKQLLPNVDDTDGFYICKMKKGECEEEQ